MNIKYRVTIEDLYQFNDYFLNTSSDLKKIIVTNQMIIGASPLIGGIIAIFLKDISFKPAVIILLGLFAVFAVPLYLLYPKHYKKKYREQIKKLYPEGENKSVLGEHEIIIEIDGFTEKTHYNQNKQSWEAIEKIVHVENALYIFISSLQAYIIPKNAIFEGNYDDFVNCLMEKHKEKNV